KISDGHALDRSLAEHPQSPIRLVWDLDSRLDRNSGLSFPRWLAGAACRIVSESARLGLRRRARLHRPAPELFGPPARSGPGGAAALARPRARDRAGQRLACVRVAHRDMARSSCAALCLDASPAEASLPSTADRVLDSRRAHRLRAAEHARVRLARAVLW